MYRKWSTFVLLALATPTFALAQSTGKLQGRVIERGDNAGLPGVTVTIEGTGLGATTDIDGNYTILGIPVGRYNVRAEFAGLNPGFVRNVVINSNATTTQDFSLTTGPVSEDVIVEYTKPIIQNDAITTGRSVQADQLENLPVRGVAAVAATQAGVVSTDGSSTLNIRGGRGEEVSYYVDGVRVIGSLGVPQQAIQEQEMILGAIPARYGDAMSGIINITTKSGISERYFGSAEAITSQFLDGFGYNLGSLSVGGPVVRNRMTFFASGEYRTSADNNPYARDVLQLSDAEFASLQGAPQVIAAEGPSGQVHYINLPGTIGSSIGSGITQAAFETLLHSQGILADSLTYLGGSPLSRAALYTASDFTSEGSKNSPSGRLDLTGNLTFRPFGTLNMRLGGSFSRGDGHSYSYTRSLYNQDRYTMSEDQTWRVFGDIRQSFNQNKGFYQINVSWSDNSGKSWPKGFSSNIEDALFYGDVDGLEADGTTHTMAYDVNAVARNYFKLETRTGTGAGTYVVYNNVDGTLPGASAIYGLFANPGASPTTFSQFHNQQFRVSGSITQQLGIHQLEAGAEYEQRTQRSYTLAGAGLAALYEDGNVEGDPALAVSNFNELSFAALRTRISPGAWFGYDWRGNEVDTENLDAFGQNVDTTPENGYIAPWKPVYYAGYVQDKIEYDDLVIQVGFRADVFNANTKVLFDPFAAEGIVRVKDLAGVSVPSNIGDDYAVYFTNGQATATNGKYTGTVVAYRDLSGNYYRASDGAVVTRASLNSLSPDARTLDGATLADALVDSKTEVTLMPRIGVSFPVTDQALFFASYNITSQRPSEAAFYAAPLYEYLVNQRIANPNLKPEKTTQYEIGFRRRLGENAALQLSGFYRTQQNKIGVRTVADAYPNTANGYSTFFNVDFTTTKGATLEFDLRRTQGLALNANYTLSFAQGTGSDAQSAGVVAWRGGYYPDFLAAASFDRRHSFNVNLDYRFGKGQGPMIFGRRLLENFGINLLGVLQSGLPYTQLSRPVTAPITSDAADRIQGGINAAYMPWTNRLDLRIDRNIAVGGRANLNLFLNVQNLLDADNILGVFRNSGLPNTDGFLGTSTGQALMNAQDNPEAYGFHYNYFTSDPGGAGAASFGGPRAYGLPRQTRLGLRLTF